MTAYLNARELRALADVLDGLPTEFRHGEITAKEGNGDEVTVAVWADDDEGFRPYVRVMDAAENEAAG